MLSFDALVRGRVKYDGEQGPGSRVPPGRCTVLAHEGVVSLTWSEEGLERSATLSAPKGTPVAHLTDAPTRATTLRKEMHFDEIASRRHCVFNVMP